MVQARFLKLGKEEETDEEILFVFLWLCLFLLLFHIHSQFERIYSLTRMQI